jgi:stage III sporulation protein AE
MKRNWMIMMIMVLIVFITIKPINVQATEDDKLDFQQKQEINKLYDYITKIKMDYEILNEIDAKDYVNKFLRTGEGNLSPNEILKYFIRYSFKEISALIHLMGVLVIISIVCALLNNLQNAFGNGNISNIAYFTCYSLIIIIIAKSFYIGVDLARETITDLTNFMAALIPVLMMLLASVGGFTQAALMDPIIMGVTNISARIFVDFIIPIIIMSFVLQFVNNISEDYKISRLNKLLNQIALWSQGIIMTIFVAIISIRSISSKAIDEVTMKTAKFAVDNFVPIVGKCLSDAISAVAGYSILLKNALGSLGLVIIIIVVIFPVLKLLIMGFLYKITAAIIEPVSDKRVVECVGAAGDSLILIMSCVLSVSIMCFIMVAIIAGTGKAIILG